MRTFGLFVLLFAASFSFSQSSSNTPDGHTPTGSATASQAVPPDSTKLDIIQLKRPDYPIEAQRRQIQGRVWVRLTVTEAGDVAEAEPVSGDPLLLDAAVAAMKQWKFAPYIKNGKPVRVTTKVPYDFAFQDKVKDVPLLPAAPPAPAATGANTENQSGAPPVVAHAPLPQRVRVSQGVSNNLLIHKVTPVYPETARQNHIEGTVVLQAVIGKDGAIKDLSLVSGKPELVDAAKGAVEQWRYKPYTLNGELVEVQTQISVNFQLHP